MKQRPCDADDMQQGPSVQGRTQAIHRRRAMPAETARAHTAVARAGGQVALRRLRRHAHQPDLDHPLHCTIPTLHTRDRRSHDRALSSPGTAGSRGNTSRLSATNAASRAPSPTGTGPSPPPPTTPLRRLRCSTAPKPRCPATAPSSPIKVSTQ